jgi:hypothetical protein
VTGKIYEVDFKHWSKDPRIVYNDDDTGLPRRGCHPLTYDIEQCVLKETEIQLNVYTDILEQPHNRYDITIEAMYAWWFPPDRDEEWEEFLIPRINVAAYYEAYMDQRPVPPPAPPPAHERALSPDIARPVPGPTTIVHIEQDSLAKDESIVWTGGAYIKNGWALPKSKWYDPKRPFQRPHTPQELARYERTMLSNDQLVSCLVRELRGKKLACWCKDGECGCHNQVLRDYANAWTT